MLQQNTELIHKSGVVKRFFADNQIQVIEWPSYSPCLYPIEHIWAISTQKVFSMCTKISKMKANAINRVLVCQWLRETWHAIGQDIIETLIGEKKNRLMVVK